MTLCLDCFSAAQGEWSFFCMNFKGVEEGDSVRNVFGHACLRSLEIWAFVHTVFLRCGCTSSTRRHMLPCPWNINYASTRKSLFIFHLLYSVSSPVEFVSRTRGSVCRQIQTLVCSRWRFWRAKPGGQLEHSVGLHIRLCVLVQSLFNCQVFS